MKHRNFCIVYGYPNGLVFKLIYITHNELGNRKVLWPKLDEASPHSCLILQRAVLITVNVKLSRDVYSRHSFSVSCQQLTYIKCHGNEISSYQLFSV